MVLNKSEEVVIHALAKRMADAIDKSVVSEYVKYHELLDRVRWLFETEDAIRYVRLLLSQGYTTLAVYRELSIWAGKAESDLRKEVANNET